MWVGLIRRLCNRVSVATGFCVPSTIWLYISVFFFFQFQILALKDSCEINRKWASKRARGRLIEMNATNRRKETSRSVRIVWTGVINLQHLNYMRAWFDAAIRRCFLRFDCCCCVFRQFFFFRRNDIIPTSDN